MKRFCDVFFACSLIAFSLILIQCQKNEATPTVKSTPNAEVPALGELAGELFGVPVPVGNYYFAKRVHTTFQTPEERKMTPAEMEKNIWHNLVLSFEASRRKIEITEKEFDEWTDSVLTALDLKFTRTQDPDKYKQWITETLKQTVELFENQMRYLAVIEKLKRSMIDEMKVTVLEGEMKADFMNIENHVGGEYTLFDTKKEADDFYAAYHDEKNWEDYKSKNPDKIKPFMLITVQAIIDLWGVPKEQINEFHGLPLGTVGKPLPFGSQSGVFRIKEKRTGDLTNFEAQREKVHQRVEARKKYQARNEWLTRIDEDANIKVWVLDDATKPATVKSEPVEADTVISGTEKSDAGKSNTVKSDASQSSDAKSGTA